MHRGRVRLNPGDAVFGDSALLFDITMDTDYDVINLKLGEGFVRQWMPSPGVLVGKRIPCDAGWGKALTSYVAQLSPQFAVQSPLPLSIVTDHLGALLGLIGNEIGGVAARRTRGDESLRDRVKDLIVQRCTETALTPQDIAETLSVSTRTLHRCLAAFGETFGAVLMSARAQAAVRMLESPLFRRLTLAEIGRRAGFIDASHFARVLRKHCGRKPSQVRAAERARSGTPGEDEQVLQ